jgi:hypothetical protein
MEQFVAVVTCMKEVDGKVQDLFVILDFSDDENVK